MHELKPFLPDGYEAISYDDMAQLFTLGKAAILPDGSWDINQVTSTGLDVGVFGAAGGRSRRPALPAGNARHGASASTPRARTRMPPRPSSTWVSGSEFQ